MTLRTSTAADTLPTLPMISHELRNRLNTVVCMVELLSTGAFGELSPGQAAAMHRLDKHVSALLDVMNAILDLARVDAGQSALEVETVDLEEVLTEIDYETRSLRDRGGLFFKWQVRPDVPLLRTAPVKLKIILGNLIGNALKFTEQGGVTVKAAPARKNSIEITIADTGISIPPELRARMFQPFQQGSTGPAVGSNGVGLGLYIVRRLLNLLGGSIKCTSEPGRGTTFRICIP